MYTSIIVVRTNILQEHQNKVTNQHKYQVHEIHKDQGNLITRGGV